MPDTLARMSAILDEDGIPLLTEAVALTPRRQSLAAAWRHQMARVQDRFHDLVAVFLGSFLAMGLVTLALRFT